MPLEDAIEKLATLLEEDIAIRKEEIISRDVGAAIVSENIAVMRALNDNLFAFMSKGASADAIAPSAKDDEPAKEPPKPKAKAKTKAKAKAKVKAKAEPEEQPEVARGDVIAALKELQEAKDSKAVKALLQTFDAKTTSGIDPERYQEVIDAAQKEAA